MSLAHAAISDSVDKRYDTKLHKKKDGTKVSHQQRLAVVSTSPVQLTDSIKLPPLCFLYEIHKITAPLVV